MALGSSLGECWGCCQMTYGMSDCLHCFSDRTDTQLLVAAAWLWQMRCWLHVWAAPCRRLLPDHHFSHALHIGSSFYCSMTLGNVALGLCLGGCACRALLSYHHHCFRHWTDAMLCGCSATLGGVVLASCLVKRHRTTSTPEPLALLLSTGLTNQLLATAA